ncbi:TetR family transcriptional regulator [Streptomyces clavifer]|uniref:TetR family transcriptional regulator n=1 Tax=Streptomyces clavifer TaxID=68188 RepID=UPI00364DDE3D
MRTTRSTRPTARRRPSDALGPVRGETRNARIIEAVPDLIVESGYADLTMAAVPRAEVAEATVFRRWDSRDDLVADAPEGNAMEHPAAPPSASRP